MKRLLHCLTIALVAFAAVSCSSDEPNYSNIKIDKTEYILPVGAKIAIAGTNLHGVEWETSDPNVAEASDGIIYGGYVGEAILTSVAPEGLNLSFRVIVPAKYQCPFPEPCLDFTLSREEMRDTLGKSITFTNSTTVDRGENDFYTTNVNGMDVSYTYFYEDSKDGVLSVVKVTAEAGIKDSLLAYLQERFDVKIILEDDTSCIWGLGRSTKRGAPHYGGSLEYKYDTNSLDLLFFRYFN